VAAPTFGAEGAGDRAPVTRAQEGQGRKTLARDIASGARGSADETSKEARRPRPRIATSAPKVPTILDTWLLPTCKVGSGWGRDKGGRV
jgi:hypothetical protein